MIEEPSGRRFVVCLVLKYYSLLVDHATRRAWALSGYSFVCCFFFSSRCFSPLFDVRWWAVVAWHTLPSPQAVKCMELRVWKALHTCTDRGPNSVKVKRFPATCNSPYACCHRDVMWACPRKPNGCSSLSSEGSECMLALLLSSLSFLCVQ